MTMCAASRIDLNADLGEGCGFDGEIIPFVTSANIACAGHAGSRDSIQQAVRHALLHNVAIGAHPGFPDREHFGRRELPVSPQEARAIVLEQVATMEQAAREMGAVVGHVKLHGALYNMASRDPALAAAICEGLAAEHPRKVLFALAGSAMVAQGRRCGLSVVGEAFADRGYRPDASLVPRSQEGALIEDVPRAVAQVLSIARNREVTAVGGERVPIDAGTLCLHGDGPKAVAFARTIRSALREAWIAVEPAYATPTC